MICSRTEAKASEVAFVDEHAILDYGPSLATSAWGCFVSSSSPLAGAAMMLLDPFCLIINPGFHIGTIRIFYVIGTNLTETTRIHWAL
jgi:hypothetical protein